jgi:CheY-like chemotaxis protein
MKLINTHTILVAEDNEDVRLFIRTFLENEGYKIVEAKNGREAVQLAQKETPDLILTDLRMPETDGVSAIKQIRLIAELREVPILVMSGYNEQEMKFSFDTDQLGTGYLHFLTKPINLEEMKEQIYMLLPVMA